MPENYDRLEVIAAAYREMPCGGAALNVGPGGAVGNGMSIVSRFGSRRAAERRLRALGFRKLSYGWKLAL